MAGVVKQNLVKTAKHVIAVASGKGGVGKSTVSSNLAISLAKKGYKVGLLDIDIYGPSIPKIFGTEKSSIEVTAEKKMIPIEKYGLKTLSIGNLVPEGTATIWRGPLIHSAITQMLSDTIWGDLDFFVLDLPPGTGDAQISLSQLLDIHGVIAVSTPQDMAMIDVKKCVNMFEKVNIPILGLVENMSYFKCPTCNEKHHIFGVGGVKAYSEKAGFPVLAEIPINQEIMSGCENGAPYAFANENTVFDELADNVIKTTK